MPEYGLGMSRFLGMPRPVTVSGVVLGVPRFVIGAGMLCALEGGTRGGIAESALSATALARVWGTVARLLDHLRCVRSTVRN